MTAPRSTRPVTPTPASTNLFRPSVTGWYAQWKAKRDAAPAPAPDAGPKAAEHPCDAADELCRWLTGQMAEGK